MNVKRFWRVLVLLTIATNLQAQTAKKEVTIYGEVVDIASYVAYGMKPNNPDRRAVAEASAKGGNPLGIVERGTGKIYMVTMSQGNSGANDKLKDYFGLRVFAKGKLYKRGGVLLFMLNDIGKSVK